MKRRTVQPAAEHGPPLPPQTADGSRDAVAFGRASIAREIVTRRRAMRLSQEKLAALAGIATQSLSRIETGAVTPETSTIIRIDRALKRHENDFFGGIRGNRPNRN